MRDLDIPIVGINTGRLGFLATIQKQDITSNITEILDGTYYTSERSLLIHRNQSIKQRNYTP